MIQPKHIGRSYRACYFEALEANFDFLTFLRVLAHPCNLATQNTI